METLDLVLIAQPIHVTTNTTREMNPNDEAPIIAPIRVLVSMESNDIQFAAEKINHFTESSFRYMENVSTLQFSNLSTKFNIIVTRLTICLTKCLTKWNFPSISFLGKYLYPAILQYKSRGFFNYHALTFIGR